LWLPAQSISVIKVIPARALVKGSPGKVVSTLSEEGEEELGWGAKEYVHSSVQYLAIIGASAMTSE
jgi:carbonic anhydrase/acetyltransferase-like protein (isoleucine patch superfamily)